MSSKPFFLKFLILMAFLTLLKASMHYNTILIKQERVRIKTYAT